MERLFVILGGVHGGVAVALGAFGAHGLRAHLEPLADGATRLAWWETAARYELAHALALGVAAWLSTRDPGRAPKVAGAAFAIGAAIFSGTLYAMALGAPRWLGAITPLGGAGLLVGWAAVIASGARRAG